MFPAESRVVLVSASSTAGSGTELLQGCVPGLWAAVAADSPLTGVFKIRMLAIITTARFFCLYSGCCFTSHFM